MKIPILSFACVIVFTLIVRGDIIPGSYSPDKKFAIAKIDDDYCIIETANHRNLGNVIPQSQQPSSSEEGISNIDIQEVRWTKDDSKVALVLYYGTKLGELLISERDANGKYRLVDFRYPDAMEFYERISRKYRSLENSSGNDEYHTGHWTNDDTIALISGVVKDDTGQHFLVMVRVTLSKGKVVVSKPEPVGVFDNDEAEGVVAKWEKSH